jgi:hypothetical protein
LPIPINRSLEAFPLSGMRIPAVVNAYPVMLKEEEYFNTLLMRIRTLDSLDWLERRRFSLF